MDGNQLDWLIPGEKELCRDEITDVEQSNLNNLKVYSKLGGVEIISFKSEISALTWFKRFTKHTTINSPIEDSFAFVFRKSLSASIDPHQILIRSRDAILNTKDIDIIHKEYSRLNFNHSWKISNVNKDFNVDDQSIKKMANFRGHNRFPSVVWRSKYTGAVLLRCSQPCIGLSCTRNEYDEQFIASVINSVIEDRKTNQIINTESKFRSGLIIIDARSYSSAQFNRLRGGGLEHSEYYQNCQVEFKDLPNLHHVRQYFEKVISLIGITPNINWFSYLETTNWLTYIGQLIKTAWDIAKKIHIYGQPVMVHCTDGWDRTSQLVSLAEILLDPYYRSIEGFRVLIEREWLMFGHKFGDRCGNGTGTLSVDERSPIFLQWLDCVFQLLRQFPQEFEFNETFLIKLAIHSYSGLFGTFLFNSERERIANKTVEKTCSLWSILTGEYEENWTIFNHLYLAKKNALLISEKDNSFHHEDTHEVFILKPRWENRYLQIWLSLYQKGFPIGHDISKAVNASKFVSSETYTDSEEEKRDDFKSDSVAIDIEKKSKQNLLGKPEPIELSSREFEFDMIKIKDTTNADHINMSDGMFLQDSSFSSHQSDGFQPNSGEFDQIELRNTDHFDPEQAETFTKRYKTVSTSSSEVGLYIVGNVNGGDQRQSDQNSLDKDRLSVMSDDFAAMEENGPTAEDEQVYSPEANFALISSRDAEKIYQLTNYPKLSNIDGIFINPDSTTIILRQQHLERKIILDNLKVTNDLQSKKINSLLSENDLLREQIQQLQNNMERVNLNQSSPEELNCSLYQDENNSPDTNEYYPKGQEGLPQHPFIIGQRRLDNVEKQKKNPSTESFDLISDLECSNNSYPTSSHRQLPKRPEIDVTSSLASDDVSHATRNTQKCESSADLTSSSEINHATEFSYESNFLPITDLEMKTATRTTGNFSTVNSIHTIEPRIPNVESNITDALTTSYSPRIVDEIKEASTSSSSSQVTSMNNFVSA